MVSNVLFYVFHICLTWPSENNTFDRHASSEENNSGEMTCEVTLHVCKWVKLKTFTPSHDENTVEHVDK